LKRFVATWGDSSSSKRTASAVCSSPASSNSVRLSAFFIVNPRAEIRDLFDLPNIDSTLSFYSNDFSIINANLITVVSDTLSSLITIDLNNESSLFPITSIANGSQHLLINSGYSGNESIESSFQILEASNIVIGDINNDGELNILDVVRLVQFVLQLQIPSDIEIYQADINVDGNLNILDVVELINMILFS